jgi:hypothetical protein
MPAVLEVVRSLSTVDMNMLAAMHSSLSTGLQQNNSFGQASFHEMLFRSQTICNGALLETIKFPRMLRQLSNVLPQSNYESKLKQAGQSMVKGKKLPSIHETRNGQPSSVKNSMISP